MPAIEKAEQVIRSAKEHHLFAKDQEKKKSILERMIEETKTLLKETVELVETTKELPGKVIKNSIEKLEQMQDVGKQLIPQIIHWMSTGRVAAGKIIHAGITEAKAIVRKKTGNLEKNARSYQDSPAEVQWHGSIELAFRCFFKIKHLHLLLNP